MPLSLYFRGTFFFFFVGFWHKMQASTVRTSYSMPAEIYACGMHDVSFFSFCCHSLFCGECGRHACAPHQHCMGNCLQYQFAWTNANFRFITFVFSFEFFFIFILIYPVVSLHCSNIYTIDWAVENNRKSEHKVEHGWKRRDPGQGAWILPLSTKRIKLHFIFMRERCDV